jgi:hypothetical protein
MEGRPLASPEAAAGSLKPKVAEDIKAKDRDKSADQDGIQVPIKPKGSG